MQGDRGLPHRPGGDGLLDGVAPGGRASDAALHDDARVHQYKGVGEGQEHVQCEWNSIYKI